MKIALKTAMSVLILTGGMSLLFFGWYFYSAEVEFVELKTDPHFKDTHWTPELKEKFMSHINSYKGRKIRMVFLDQMARDLRELYPAAELRIHRQLPNRIIVFLKKAPLSFAAQRSRGENPHFLSRRSATSFGFKPVCGFAHSAWRAVL